MDILNRSAKEAALRRLRDCENSYNQTVKVLNISVTELFMTRKKFIHSTIKKCEEFLNIISDVPKDIVITIEEFNTLELKFHVLELVESDNQNYKEAAINSTIGAAIGVSAASAAPPLAMIVATTFGTASTGAAISSLSGVAATNAAVAWLGGGAVAAGGGGIIGGKALLALAGPVGWVIGGGAIAFCGYKYASQNNETIREANDIAKRLLIEELNLKKTQKSVESLKELTQKHGEALDLSINTFKMLPKSYKAFTLEQKKKLGCFINNMNTLKELVLTKVDLNG